jgi:hypothetical protein
MAERRRGARAAVAGDDAVQVLALIAACTFALVVGFALAIVLPSAAALHSRWGLRWPALVQVHGQAMVLGWAGLFVLGMAARLLPRFGGAPLRHPAVLRAALVLIAAGIALRAVTQPLSDYGVARWLLFGSSFLVLAGALCFAVPGLLTLSRPLHERRQFAYFAGAGLLWLAIAALLTVRALARLLSDGGMIVPATYDAPLIAVEFYGFLVNFIVAVSLRSVPVLYAWPVRTRLSWSAFALLNAGTLALLLASLAGDGPDGAWWLDATGGVLIALGLLVAAFCMGVWRPASRLRANARLVGLLLLYGAVEALRHRAPPPSYVGDAARHVIGIGVVSMLIVGMTYLVGHTFAEERANDAGMPMRLRLYHVLLSTAAFLRAGAALLEGHGAPLWRFWLMAGAGVCAFAAVALFAYRLGWGLRHPYVPPVPARSVHAREPGS